MKRLSLVALGVLIANFGFSQNPLIKHMFTADPSAHVFDNKMYVYPSHDRDDAQGFNMTDYHVFSSSDLVNWKDHAVALDIKDVPWAKEFMWAPDCVFKNGIYYLYFPVRDKEGVFRIGVATSTKPMGPFKAEPNPIKGSFSVDPAVFIDTDGQSYMYFGGAGQGGQKTPWVAKMDASMKEFAVAPTALKGVDYWFEACWMNKINNTYYLSYSTGGKHPEVKGSSGIAYATSDNPMGPFKYQGLVNNKVSGWTNHHSIVEWKGQTYFFYHNSDRSKGKTNQRCIVADYVHITPDGVIYEVIQTKTGIGHYNGLEKIEAENYSQGFGVTKKGKKEDMNVEFTDGDSVVFNAIDFGDKKVKSVQINYASESKKGELEIRENDAKGRLLVKIPIKSTNGNLNKEAVTAKLPELVGKKNIVVVFKGKGKESVVLDWLLFNE